jgi:hypothetical protein
MAVEGFSFGLRDAKIAPWTAPGTYGTAVDVESIRVFNAQMETTSGRLEGDDKRTSLYAVPVGGTVQLQFGFKTLDVLAKMSGLTVADSTTAKALTWIWQPYPYFGIIAQVYQEDAVGAYDLFIPKCKIMGNLQFGNLAYGQFWSQTVDAEFIEDDSQYGFARVIARATAVALTIPPAALS